MASNTLKLIFSAFFFLELLNPSTVFGAACCGARATLPNLIVGDYRTQWNISWANAAITHQASSAGQVSKRQGNNQEVQETISLSGAYLISDLWQIQSQIPIRKNSRRTLNEEEQHTALGDISIGVAYEFLPETFYSAWKPRGFVFAFQNFPTGKSTYESDTKLGTDATGKGYGSTGLGLALIKNWGHYDGIFSSEYHRGWKERFQANQNTFALNPRYGFSSLLGAGVSPYQGNFRIGGTLGYSFEAGALVNQGRAEEKTSPKYLWDVGLNLSYLYGNSSLLFGYNDQTVIGKANNANLARSLLFSWQYFFER